MLFNNVDLSPYLRIKEIKGRGMVTSEIQLYEGLRRNGARFKRKRRPPRTLEIRADIKALNREDLRGKLEELNGILAVPEPVPIVFPDEPNRTYIGIPAASSEDGEVTYLHKGVLNIICPDPDKLGQTKTLNLTTSIQTFSVTGQTETPWTSRTLLTVPQSQFVLENNEGGKVILNYNFVAGDILEIDYDTRDVILNGNDLAVSISLETNWFDLKPGQVQLRASHNTALTYSERFY